MKKITFPVLRVRLVPTDKIKSNDYNPNSVAPPEMALLKYSIEEDGYTQPIVAYYDENEGIYIIVDGFHRYKCGIMLKLKELPVTVIDKPIKNRMASTVRHNRARGVHSINGMSAIVLDMYKNGWTDEMICKEMGMQLEEVVRLKQITGLKEAFANRKFSKSWEEFIINNDVA